MIVYIQNETYSEKIILFPQSEVLAGSLRYEIRRKPNLKDKYFKGECYSEPVFKTDLEKINDSSFKLNSFQLDFCCGDYIEEYWVKFVNGTQISLLQRELKLKPSFSYLDKVMASGAVPYNNISPKVYSKTIDGNVITITEDSDLIQVVFQTVGLNGASAYEIAVYNGFVGTEEEWLEILKGEQGGQGIQGEKGEKGDKGDNGWSPKFVFEEDGVQRLVKKLDSWIGGTGAAPTDNIGQYVIDGGYTSVKANATNFKGAQSDNLLIEYVHSGNKEVYIDSIDYSTNTFTSVGNGLVNGDRLGLNLLKQIDDRDQSPFTKLPVNTMVFSGFYVVNITTDTFQIATTNGGTPITLINESTLDLSFFRFEVVTNTNLTFSEINFNDIKMTVVGGFARPPRYITFKGGLIGFISRSNNFNFMTHDSDLWSLGGTYSISITTNDEEEVKQRTWSLLQFNPMFNNGVLNEIIYSIDSTQTSLEISNGFLPYNGTTIKIYKL